MEDRSTTTSATTALQGANENHGNDRETHVIEDRSTTASTTTVVHGGMQLGNNNSIIYRNCAIYYITNNCKQCHHAEDHVVSEATPRDLIPSSSVHTTTRVRLVDFKGRELELGDIVEADLKYAIYTDWFINVDSEGRELGLGYVVIADRSTLWSIYAGDGMIIRLDKKTRKIVHKPINVKERFTSYPSPGRRSTYSPIQIVQRAKGKLGQRYDNGPMDFVIWCHKDMTLEEWFEHEGVQDPNVIEYLRRWNTVPDQLTDNA